MSPGGPGSPGTPGGPFADVLFPRVRDVIVQAMRTSMQTSMQTSTKASPSGADSTSADSTNTDSTSAGSTSAGSSRPAKPQAKPQAKSRAPPPPPPSPPFVSLDATVLDAATAMVLSGGRGVMVMDMDMDLERGGRSSASNSGASASKVGGAREGSGGSGGSGGARRDGEEEGMAKGSEDEVAKVAEVAEGGVKLRRLAGLFTTQDLVRRVISRGRGMDDTLVREVMTPEPECIHGNSSILDALHVMLQVRAIM